MDRTQLSPRLACFTQCSPDTDTIVTAEDYTGDELQHIIACLKADYAAVRGKRPYEENLLPGYVIRYEDMTPGESLSIVLWPQGAPHGFESMILSCAVVLKPNDINEELRGYAQNHPEYGYKIPPKPPYCAIIPQDAYDKHPKDREAILKTVRGMALAWLILTPA